MECYGNNQEKIEKTFTFRPITEDQEKRSEEIMDYGRLFCKAIDFRCPDSKEKVLAFIKIKEAVLWAIESIIMEEHNDK